MHIPGRGYVGVGTVTGPPQPLKDFLVPEDGTQAALLQVKPEGHYLAEYMNDSELTEYFVPVEWIKTVPEDQAFWRKGMYANQTVATKLRNQTTLALLRDHFKVDE